MNEMWRNSIAAIAVTLALGSGSVSRAHDGHHHDTAMHGGTVEKTKHYQFEVVCAANGLKLYAYGMDGKPLDGSKLTAKATFYHPNSPKPWFDRPLRYVVASPGQTSSSFNLNMDLSTVPARGAKVAFELSGLPDADEPASTITVPFAVPGAAPVTVTATAPAVITFAKATRADQAGINAQKVCKVSGGSLFAMGGPVKVSRGDKSVFICCQSCLKAIQANPDKYLGAMAATATK